MPNVLWCSLTIFFELQISSCCSFKNDIGLAVEGRTSLSDVERRSFLNNSWTPPFDYKFPTVSQGDKRRSFRVEWLRRFPWLSYSDFKNGAFCRFCVIFAPECVGKGSIQPVSTLVSQPLNKFKDAIETLTKHQKAKYHQLSAEMAEAFVKEDCDVRNLMIQGRKEQMEENRKRYVLKL